MYVLQCVWYVSQYVCLSNAVSVTTLSLTAHIRNKLYGKCVHPNTVVKLIIKGYLYLPGMNSTNLK